MLHRGSDVQLIHLDVQRMDLSVQIMDLDIQIMDLGIQITDLDVQIMDLDVQIMDWLSRCAFRPCLSKRRFWVLPEPLNYIIFRTLFQS